MSVQSRQDIHYNGNEPAIPSSVEAEEAVLGALLTNPKCYHLIATILKAEDFFLLRHQWIWEAATRLMERGDSLDYLTVGAELRRLNHLDEIGGIAYLMRLINNTPTSVHVETYAHLVKRTGWRRNLLTLAEGIKAAALEESLSVDDVAAWVSDNLWPILHNQQTNPLRSMSELVDEVLSQVENGAAVRRIPTGFPTIDQDLGGGLGCTWLTLIASRPGMGKTQLMLQLAINAALEDHRVIIASLEQRDLELATRTLANLMQARQNVLTDGQFDAQRYGSRLMTAAEKAVKLPIKICDQAKLDIQGLAALARYEKHTNGLDTLFVDYVQLMNAVPNQGRSVNRYQELGAISKGLKELAKELDISVVALAQVSREVDTLSNKRPLLKHLRESGNLEADADIVWFPYRDDYYNPQPKVRDVATQRLMPNPISDMENHMAKFRNGPSPRTWKLTFNQTNARFSEKVREIDLR